jgi:hypothetical protein
MVRSIKLDASTARRARGLGAVGEQLATTLLARAGSPGIRRDGYFFAFGPRFCGFHRKVEGTIQTLPNFAAPATLPWLQSFCTWRMVVPTRSAASAVVMNFAVNLRATSPLFAPTN